MLNIFLYHLIWVFRVANISERIDFLLHVSLEIRITFFIPIPQNWVNATPSHSILENNILWFVVERVEWMQHSETLSIVLNLAFLLEGIENKWNQKKIFHWLTEEKKRHFDQNSLGKNKMSNATKKLSVFQQDKHKKLLPDSFGLFTWLGPKNVMY